MMARVRSYPPVYKRLADALGALRRLEWTEDENAPRSFCPACGAFNRVQGAKGWEARGHADGCWLRALLDRLEAP